jgi:hypothetical protein
VAAGEEGDSRGGIGSRTLTPFTGGDTLLVEVGGGAQMAVLVARDGAVSVMAAEQQEEQESSGVEQAA